jgi:hypothetical protein
VAWSNERSEYEVLSLNSGFFRMDAPGCQYTEKSKEKMNFLTRGIIYGTISP